MIPKDLSGFSIEQLRGFAKAVTASIAELQASKPDGGTFSLEQASNLESLADDHVRLHEAIQAATEAEATAAAAEAAVAAATETESNEEEDANAEGEGESTDEEDENPDAANEPNADDVVDEAVAAATMGGGDAPRVVSETTRAHREDLRKFVNAMVGGNRQITQQDRHSFSTLKRETNHVVRKNQDANEAIAAAIASRKAGTDKTAAGAFCGPDDAVTDIKQSGETVRPVSDTLPTVTASGDIRYIRELDIADALAGVTQWTGDDQSDVDPDDRSTWKPCFDLDCQEEQTSALYAVTACASFNTQQMIGNPALVDNLQHVMEVAFNKTAEILVYNRLRALSSKYEFGLNTEGYGASAQLIASVGWALELVHANLRETDPGYTLVLPAGLADRVVTDGMIRGFGDYKTKAELYDRIKELGVANIVEAVDEIVCPGGGGATAHAGVAAAANNCTYAAATAHPTQQELLLYRPEDFVLGVGPDIDLGVQRSPELARQNKLQWFTESFEFVEKVGTAPSLSLLVPFCANGVRPALGEGLSCEEGG